MRIFQSLHIYPPYIPHFEQKYAVENMSYEEHRKTLIRDRFYASHILQPCLRESDNGFYTLWDYANLQHKWAKEKGWNETDLKKILFAQIEEFKPDVFYTGSPLDYTKEDLDSLLNPVIKRVCWSASPIVNLEKFALYETRLTNLPLDIKTKAEVGFRNDLFQPAHDPVMNTFAENSERPIDVLFYGQYATAFFKRRNQLIDELIKFKKKSKVNIEIYLQYGIYKVPLVNIPLIRRYLKKDYPSKSFQKEVLAPTYGLDLYDKIGKSKIVFNSGVDFSKQYKVNMRNFEALGCGAHMLSDEGIYPDGFKAGVNFSTYKNMDDCIVKIKELLDNPAKRIDMAAAGHQMVKTNYSKEKQWEKFQQIVASL